MLRRTLATLASAALAVSGVAAGALPAQAAPGTAVTASTVAVAEADDGLGSTLTGTVVDAQGRGLAGVVVHAQRLANGKTWYVETAADGAFSVDVRGGGSYRLGFSDEPGRGQYTFTTTVRTASVAKGETLAVGTIKLARPYGWGTSNVVITVRGPLGDEEAPSLLHLKDSRGRIVAVEGMYDDIDPNRRAIFNDLAAGRYRAIFPATGQSVALNVGAGETATAQLRVKAPKKRGNLEVDAVDSKGRSLSGALSLTDRHGRVVGYSWSGNFKSVLAGRYTVAAQVGERSYQKSVVVKHGRTTKTTLRARPTGGTLAGTVKGVRGTAFAKVILKGVGKTKGRYETWTGDGRYVFRGVKPGRYRVVVQDVTSYFGGKYTIGGLPDAYYKGSTYKKSRILTIKDGRTTRLAKIAFRG